MTERKTMPELAWDEIASILVAFLITLPFLMLVASESLVDHILATHPSQETIRQFLELLPSPVREVCSILTGSSQTDLTTTSQHMATSQDRNKRSALAITRLGFSLIPILFVIVHIHSLTTRENVIDRAIFAGLAVTEFILWYFAMRFGRKLKTMTANGSTETPG